MSEVLKQAVSLTQAKTLYDDLRQRIESGVIPDISGKLDSSLKGANSGLAELDSSGKVPTSQLPSYVDDVVEYAGVSSFPSTGESGKIYVALDTNKTYRWSGSEYVEISPSLALGETSSTAYRGDRGKSAYDHATESGKISSAVSSGLYKFSATAQGHIASTTAVQKSDITALGIPAQDTTYQSKVAASGGTDVSLVTTGEKYTWDSKYDKPSGGIPASDLASGVIPDVTGKADKTDTVLLTTLSRGRQENTTVGTGSFAFGLAVTASGNYSHAEGLTTTASGGYSHTEGNGSVASGNYSHAEGMATASGNQAHAEGISVASGSSSHAEGYGNASSMASHAEGLGHANGMFSHAEGNGSSANGMASHAEGYATVADGAYSHVIGSYNVNLNSGTSSGNKGTHVEIVGNGTADDARSNAYALTWTGDGRYAGDVYAGCNSDSSGGTKLATVNDIPDVSGFYTKPSTGIPASDLASGVIPSVPVQDVQVNGTSVVSNGVANVPLANTSTFGAVMIGNGLKLNDSNKLVINRAAPTTIKNGVDGYYPIVSGYIDYATFYGLSKVAGVDLANETVTVGTYPASSKAAIKTMLGVTDLPTVTSSDNDKVLKVVSGAWAAATAPSGSGLPSVTSSDNGKFLRVVDGAWAVATVSSANGVSF